MSEAVAAGPYCEGCGLPAGEGDHRRCAERQEATDPPRFCPACSRKLAVQVLPVGFSARCVSCGPLTRP